MPLLLLLFYVFSAILAPQLTMFALIFLAQTVFYGLALHVHYQRKREDELHKTNKFLAVIYYFVAGYWFSFIGMLQYLFKQRTFKV